MLREEVRAKSQLVGEVCLELRGAVEGAAHREEQMVMARKVYDRSKIERGVRLPADFGGCAVVEFRPNEDVLHDLDLCNCTQERPVPLARARIDAVAGSPVEGPRAEVFLEPKW